VSGWQAWRREDDDHDGRRLATHPAHHGRGVPAAPDGDGRTTRARRRGPQAQAERQQGSRPSRSGAAVSTGAAGFEASASATSPTSRVTFVHAITSRSVPRTSARSGRARTLCSPAARDVPLPPPPRRLPPRSGSGSPRHGCVEGGREPLLSDRPGGLYTLATTKEGRRSRSGSCRRNSRAILPPFAG